MLDWLTLADTCKTLYSAFNQRTNAITAAGASSLPVAVWCSQSVVLLPLLLLLFMQSSITMHAVDVVADRLIPGRAPSGCAAVGLTSDHGGRLTAGVSRR